MPHNHQRSSVLPLLTWPSPQPAKQRNASPITDLRVSTDKQLDDRLVEADPSVRTSKDWVQRADHLKDEAGDLMSSRSPSFQVWQERRITRLLEEHWHAVTMALKKLSAEVASLQAQIAGREKAELQTGNSVKTLEFQQASLVQDLRSRVGRCDASIAVISSDIRSLAESLSAINRQVSSLSTALERGHKNTDEKVSRLQVDMQEQSKHQNQTRSVTESKLEENVTSLEFKTKSQLKELHNNIQALQTEYQVKQKKLQQELAQSLEQLHGQNQQKQTQLERQITERLQVVEDAVSQMKKEQVRLRAANEEQNRELKVHVKKQLSKMEETLMGVIKVEVEDVKSMLHSGLGTTQSNLETMRTVLEGKQRLQEESLKREIAGMKKLVVLT